MPCRWAAAVTGCEIARDSAGHRQPKLQAPLLEETGGLALGSSAWLYARTTAIASVKGRYLFWGFVIFLAAMQVYGNFGPAPSSPEGMATTALALYGMLALLAAWVERTAVVPTERELEPH